ncbi:hypothetical protein LY76DRAFT_600652 [Colletotrichum caudatum]|nr:hypothetical protein LY76DRAFT_600652 [Colletotrichum caudatum]
MKKKTKNEYKCAYSGTHGLTPSGDDDGSLQVSCHVIAGQERSKREAFGMRSLASVLASKRAVALRVLGCQDCAALGRGGGESARRAYYRPIPAYTKLPSPLPRAASREAGHDKSYLLIMATAVDWGRRTLICSFNCPRRITEDGYGHLSSVPSLGEEQKVLCWQTTGSALRK